MSSDTRSAPRVRVLVTSVDGADLDAALAIVGRQVYEPKPELVVVGAENGSVGDHETADSLEEAIAASGQDVDYLWILHSDARPRPDALSALVAETERNDASLGGSKLLLAGTKDQLESVGSATDVFGEPHSGLEEGEIDLQQYDVVREVAFVRSASMLVRRDLAQGLKGLDELLPPIAAGLDFSQRARLAGGKVISVPSSEVYHQGRCNEKGHDWREQAGRLRAMLIAYRPLTLAWVVPYDLGVTILDSLANLLLLRWRPAAKHGLSWAWNVFHLPSTLGRRRRFRLVRASGDEELFRFQARGSVRLREVGSEISTRLISIFDEDQALARGTKRVWASPGIWGAFLAAVVVVVSARALIFTGMPDAGFNFPFENAGVAFQRWVAGWNESGLGAPTPVYPGTAVTGAATFLAFDHPGAARTTLTIGLALLAIIGMGRLGGRLGLRGPGRYLGGIVLLAGPGTTLLSGDGSWWAFAGAAILPWAVRAGMDHPTLSARARWARVGWALLTGLLLVSLSPLLIVIPIVGLGLSLGTEARPNLLRVAALLIGIVAAVAATIGDPSWLLDPQRRFGLEIPAIWPGLMAVVAIFTLLLSGIRRAVGAAGGLIGLLFIVLHRLGLGGPAVEHLVLIGASFGAALIVAAGFDKLDRKPIGLMAGIGALCILVFSVTTFGNGRLGLSAGDINDRLGFAAALAGDVGPGRVLLASTERSDIPGEARRGPGFWYRLVDGAGITNDEAWLPEPREGDDALASAIDVIATGDQLRPGALLAPFAVDWVVLDGPEFRLDDVLVTQLDLIPTPLDPESRVFQNANPAPLAATVEGDRWTRDGADFVGDALEGSVILAVNYDDGWTPEASTDSWNTIVDGRQGRVEFKGSTLDRSLAWVTASVTFLALGLIAFGRSRR